MNSHEVDAIDKVTAIVLVLDSLIHPQRNEFEPNKHGTLKHRNVLVLSASCSEIHCHASNQSNALQSEGAFDAQLQTCVVV